MTATVQFYISKPAVAAVKLKELRDRCRARGMEGAQFESSTFRAQGKVRITCKAPIAEVLLEELRVAAASASPQQLRIECARAAEVIEKALTDPYTGYSSAVRKAGPSDEERGLLAADDASGLLQQNSSQASCTLLVFIRRV
jgi:hypothetical protein